VYEQHIAVLRSQLGESNSNFFTCSVVAPQPGSPAKKDVPRRVNLDTLVPERDVQVDINDGADSKAERQAPERFVLATEAESQLDRQISKACKDAESQPERQTSKETKDTESQPKRDLSHASKVSRAVSALRTQSDGAPKHHVMYNYLSQKSKQGHSHIQKLRDSMSEYLTLRYGEKSKHAGGSGILQRHGKIAKFKRMANTIIESPYFEAACAIFIFLNAIFLGIHTDYLARAESINDVPGSFASINRFFSIWFFCELLLRLFAHGVSGFFCSKSWFINIFDLIIVILDWWEVMIEHAMAADDRPIFQTTVFRMLRVLRVVRALRVVKLIQFFKEFRMMVLSVLKSGMLLIWSLAVLSMIIFVFGIFLTLNVTYNLKGLDEQVRSTDQAGLVADFGTLGAACYTLFKAISGGISWQEISDPLFEMEWAAGAVFVSYVFFTVFSLLNIINGIFVDYAISSVQNDRDEVIHAQLTSDESISRQLRDIFKQADCDGSGSLSLDELETHLSDPKVIKHFGLLGIEISEARSMFKLLDLSRSGNIGVDEFVFGCMRIKGAAKTVDLLTLMYENKRMCQLMRECFAELVELIEARSKPLPEEQKEETARVLTEDLKSKLLSSSSTFALGDASEPFSPKYLTHATSLGL